MRRGTTFVAFAVGFILWVGEEAQGALAASVRAAALPGGPELVSVASIGGGKMKIVWVDNSSNETHFLIKRVLSACIPDPDEPAAAPCATTAQFQAPANSVEFIEEGVPDGLTISYHVAACDSSGCTNWSTGRSAPTARGKYFVGGKAVDRALDPIEGADVVIAERSTNWQAFGRAANLSNPSQSQSVTVTVTQKGGVQDLDVPCYVGYSGSTVARVLVSVTHPDGTSIPLHAPTPGTYFSGNCSVNTTKDPNSPLAALKGRAMSGNWTINYAIKSASPGAQIQAQIGQISAIFEGASTTAKTDGKGAFALPDVPFGNYTLYARHGDKIIGIPRAFTLAKDVFYQHFIGR